MGDARSVSPAAAAAPAAGPSTPAGAPPTGSLALPGSTRKALLSLSPHKSSSAEDPQLTKSLFKHGWAEILRGVDPAAKRRTFWDEFFLIKVHTQHLRLSLRQVDSQSLLSIRKTLHLVFDQCVASIGSSIQIRAANGMLTLGILLQEMFAKKGFENFSYDVVDVVVGFDDAPRRMSALITAVAKLLKSRTAGDQLKDVALRLLIIVATATPRIEQNVLLEHLMVRPIFDELVALLRKEERAAHGYHTLLLLGLLLSYRRKDGSGGNPYVASLRDLHDPVGLNAIGAVISSVLVNRNREWAALADAGGAGSSGGILSDVGSFFSKLFDVPDESSALKIRPAESAALLLPLYQIVRLNAGFVDVVTHTQVLDELRSADAAKASAQPAANAKAAQSEGTNLLSSFLTFSSFLLHDTKPASTASFCYLCWTILLCICDDKHVDTFLHDTKVTVSIALFYAEKRHRPAEMKRRESGPLAAAVFDLCVEFMLSHLKKHLQADLYSLCLGVVHRLLCYQKKNQVRLRFEWKSLWTALITTCSFLVGHEVALIESGIDIFSLASQVITNLNLFITFGDTFLPDPSSYDELYYELIRVHSTFEGLYNMAKRHTRGEHGAAAEKLTHDLVNIRAITNHFNPRIAAWKHEKGVSSLTTEEVLKLVRDNYDTLTLKLSTGLTKVAPFSETAEHAAKLAEVVHAIVDAHHTTALLVPTIAPGH